MKKDLEEFSDILNIRAHHLLCVQGFQGRGYSQGFVKNMDKIVNFLKNNPQTLLKVISSTDDICYCCPHNIENTCKQSPSAEDKVKKMDLETLNYLGLEEHDITTYEHIIELLSNRLDSSDLKEICGFCLWIECCNLHK